MSGIIGIYNLDGKSVNSANLRQMVDILAHRGPDGADTWNLDNIGLGHRMLWTTPESLLEKLPETNPTGELTITADARIDNRDELISQLPLTHRPTEKITDSQIILAAYEKWGEACPEYLLGDFAFAIWDTRKQSLFCARDHFGVKPFYYYYQPSSIFLFASEIKAIFGIPEVPRRLNEVMFAYYLAGSLENKTLTTYQNIFRLPPAHSMVVSESGMRSQCYWSLDPNRELKLESDQAYAEAFREIFTEAVRCRLRSAFPIASHLSGGLDSSSVTCVARQLLTQADRPNLHTLSNIFEDVPECDERPFINTVLEGGKLIPHYIRADQNSPLFNLDNIWQYEEEAFTGPSHYFVWGLSQAAQSAGVRVVLDGLDGDNTVSHGGARFAELARLGEWETFKEEAEAAAPHFYTSPLELLNCHGVKPVTELAQKFRWVAFAKNVHQLHQQFRLSRKQLWWRLGIMPLIPKQIWQMWYQWRNRGKATTPVATIINPNFAQRIGLEEKLEALGSFKEAPSTAREEHWRNLTSGLFPYILERTDRYAAAFGLDARHPFMDKRLIEFCLALPAEQKLYQGWSRMIMRRGLANILPEKIQWRRGKTDMTPNLLYSMLTLGRPVLEEALWKIPNIQEYINLEFFQSAYERFTSTKKPNDRDIMTVWKGVILALWCNSEASKASRWQSESQESELHL